MDGYSSHYTLEFLEFCTKNDIIPFGLPTHSTHLLQPLDMVVFQLYKHYYRKALNSLVQEGVESITELEFLAEIEAIRRLAFKERTIKGGFKRTGIYPFKPKIVLKEIRARNPPPLPQTPP